MFSLFLSVLGHLGSHSCTYRVASVYMPKEGDLQMGPRLFIIKDVTNRGSSWISINSKHRLGKHVLLITRNAFFASMDHKDYSLSQTNLYSVDSVLNSWFC